MEKILDYVKYNDISVEVLQEIVITCNSWNGSLEDYEYMENNEYFFNDYFYNRPDEAVRATFYGDYRYNDDWVRFNAYGNLDSCSDWEREDRLTDGKLEIMETYLDLLHANNVDKIDMEDDELNELIDNWLDGEEEDE